MDSTEGETYVHEKHESLNVYQSLSTILCNFRGRRRLCRKNPQLGDLSCAYLHHSERNWICTVDSKSLVSRHPYRSVDGPAYTSGFVNRLREGHSSVNFGFGGRPKSWGMGAYAYGLQEVGLGESTVALKIALWFYFFAELDGVPRPSNVLIASGISRIRSCKQ